MNVGLLMARDVVTCATTASLNEPARAMWDKDVGFVPVVAPDTGALAGVITDRDICMAAMTKGKPLHEIPVSDIMQKDVHVCVESDHVARAESIMRDHQLRRVPVVDGERRVVGVVTLNDLARHAEFTAGKGMRDAFVKTAAEVFRPHGAHDKAGLPQVEQLQVAGA